MNTVRWIMAILTGLLLFSTVVCGLWIRYSGEADNGSISFHMVIGIATAIATAVTIVLSVIR
ncbi:MAG: hypothetical protein GY832_28280 [Chloroflexi bacterium]|nr:hypothetical protein [Chloroflexota bacterium]